MFVLTILTKEIHDLRANNVFSFFYQDTIKPLDIND